MINDQDLLQAVTDAANEEYVVYGMLGREESGACALLALDRAANVLALLMGNASTGPDGEVELGIEVRTELDALVPETATVCIACDSRLRPSGRFCPNCGLDVRTQAVATEDDPAEMRAAVQASIGDDYEFLGEMRRQEQTGRVYFVREKTSGAITPLRLSRGAAAGEFELVETDAIRKALPATS